LKASGASRWRALDSQPILVFLAHEVVRLAESLGPVPLDFIFWDGIHQSKSNKKLNSQHSNSE
jgi:hypothetical protein